jgi:hypothetical protein
MCAVKSSQSAETFFESESQSKKLHKMHPLYLFKNFVNNTRANSGGYIIIDEKYRSDARNIIYYITYIQFKHNIL